jgi:tryptophanyl-tRNA synthetase
VGNLIGAIRNYVAYQDQGEALYCAVDLHALTVVRDPEVLRQQTHAMAAMLLAAGLDPERCILFVQSHVGQVHSELAWLLQCVATYGELHRMTQFKEKSEGQSSVSVGLFTYPVLMAADIFLYSADAVPVGADQKQHLELARDLAQRFNSRFGETFTVPEPIIPEVGGRVMDLQDPERKMSTTGGTEKGTVNVLDSAEVVAKKVRSAVTDSGSEVYASPEKPGVTNLLEIMSISTGRSVADLEGEYRNSGYGTFKPAVADALVEYLRPIRERYEELISDLGELDRILADGAEKAAALAEPKLAEAKDRMGLLAPGVVTRR